MTKPGAANPMELGNGQHPNQNWIRRRRRSFMQFPTKKVRKKILTQNFEILRPSQIAQIENFEIPTSQGDVIYLDDLILKNSASH